MLSQIKKDDMYKEFRLDDRTIKFKSSVSDVEVERIMGLENSIYKTFLIKREGLQFQHNFRIRLFDVQRLLHIQIGVLGLYAFREPLQPFLVVKKLNQDLSKLYPIDLQKNLKEMISNGISPIYEIISSDVELFQKVLHDFPELKSYI